MKFRAGLLILVCFSGHSYAQKPAEEKWYSRVQYDTGYVRSYYDNYLHVTLISTSLNQSLDVANIENDINVSYRPNNAFRFGIGFDYRFMTLEYAQSIDALDEPDPKLGQTKSISLRLGVTGRRYLVSALIQRFQGMYVSNPQDLKPQAAVLQNRVRNDLTSEVLLGSMYYFFNNRKYSAMAGLWQIDRQRKTAGSLASGITLSANHLKADTSLIPNYLLNSIHPEDRVIESYTYLIGLNGGYAFNVVAKGRLFLNLMLMPGINLQFGNYTVEGNTRSAYQKSLGYHGDIRIVAGYNGEKFYGGVHYANYFNSNTLKSTVDVNLYNTYFRVFIGRRFDLQKSAK